MNEFCAAPLAALSTPVPQSVALPVTVVTATWPKILSKRYSLSAAGELEKLSGGILVEGRVEVRNLNGLQGLARLLPTLTSAQALIYGVPRDPAAKQVVTKNLLAKTKETAGKTTRTNGAFRWPDGSGVMMIDYDPEPGAEPLSRQELVEEIRRAAPGLADHAMLWWMSASSAIYDDERELRGVTGQRLWLHVADASDIPRAGSVLADRLWLASCGTIRVSSSGSMLERTLVDTTVWQPSRLDFAGGAECAAPLTQKRGCPVLIEGGQEIVDTKVVFANPAETERKRLRDLKKAARVLQEAEASERRAEWEARRIEGMLRALGDSTIDPQREEQLRQVLEQALTSNDLHGNYVVEVELENGIVPVTVSQILADRALYDGRSCRDPVEPEYDGGRLVGKLFVKGGSPVLHSFARGGGDLPAERQPDPDRVYGWQDVATDRRDPAAPESERDILRLRRASGIRGEWRTSCAVRGCVEIPAWS